MNLNRGRLVLRQDKFRSSQLICVSAGHGVRDVDDLGKLVHVSSFSKPSTRVSIVVFQCTYQTWCAVTVHLYDTWVWKKNLIYPNRELWRGSNQVSLMRAKISRWQRHCILCFEIGPILRGCVLDSCFQILLDKGTTRKIRRQECAHLWGFRSVPFVVAFAQPIWLPQVGQTLRVDV